MLKGIINNYIPHWFKEDKNDYEYLSSYQRVPHTNEDYKHQLRGVSVGSESYARILLNAASIWIPDLPNRHLLIHLAVYSNYTTTDQKALLVFYEIADAIHDEIRIRERDNMFDPNRSYSIWGTKEEEDRVRNQYWSYLCHRIRMHRKDWSDSEYKEELRALPLEWLEKL